MAVYGIFHEGSGLGNQLHRYVATRVLAEDMGYDFGMVAPENFKGSSFMNLPMGKPFPGTYTVGEGGEVIPISSLASFSEKKITENGVDIRGYDPDFNFIADNTVIDGEFQDERYFVHMGDEIKDWLQVEYLGMPNDVCVIGFRGGEFQHFPDLFLPESYWNTAMAVMRSINPQMKFHVVTDDPELARRLFPPEVKVLHEIGTDWRMVRHARYLIIANSSFYILPAILNENVQKVIAPRYWARHNTGTWSTRQNFYTKFSYI